MEAMARESWTDERLDYLNRRVNDGFELVDERFNQVDERFASLWEIAIKSAVGKLEAPDDLPARVEEMGFELLPVMAEHAWRVRSLPHHHGDPFDRLLIAQAQLERLPIVTADAAFQDYDVAVVWA